MCKITIIRKFTLSIQKILTGCSFEILLSSYLSILFIKIDLLLKRIILS